MESDKLSEKPSWMLYFDGGFYDSYLNNMRKLNLSRMHINNINEEHKNDIKTNFNVLNQEQSPIGTNPYLPNGLNNIPVQTEDEIKWRKRRTHGIVIIGILLIAGIAAATSLVMHLVFIEDKDPFAISDLPEHYGREMYGTTTTLPRPKNKYNSSTGIKDKNTISTTLSTITNQRKNSTDSSNVNIITTIADDSVIIGNQKNIRNKDNKANKIETTSDRNLNDQTVTHQTSTVIISDEKVLTEKHKKTIKSDDTVTTHSTTDKYTTTDNEDILTHSTTESYNTQITQSKTDDTATLSTTLPGLDGKENEVITKSSINNYSTTAQTETESTTEKLSTTVSGVYDEDSDVIMTQSTTGKYIPGGQIFESTTADDIKVLRTTSLRMANIYHGDITTRTQSAETTTDKVSTTVSGVYGKDSDVIMTQSTTDKSTLGFQMVESTKADDIKVLRSTSPPMTNTHNEDITAINFQVTQPKEITTMSVKMAETRAESKNIEPNQKDDDHDQNFIFLDEDGTTLDVDSGDVIGADKSQHTLNNTNVIFTGNVQSIGDKSNTAIVLESTTISLEPDIYCKHNPTSLMIDPTNCARYYNCSDPSIKQGLYKAYLSECKYPRLFNETDSKCQLFTKVTCGYRYEPKAPCEYVENKCFGDSCEPCEQTSPSCVGRDNGYIEYSKHSGSTSYIVCLKERTVGQFTCKSGIYDKVKKKCIDNPPIDNYFHRRS